MNEKKSVKKVTRTTAVILIVLGILFGVVGTVLPHYDAVVKEVSEVHTTRRKKSGKRYYVRATVVYTDAKGEEHTATGVRITRSRESSLPKIGDSIQVMKLLYMREYQPTTALGSGATFILIGILSFIASFRKAKNRPSPEAEETDTQ